MTLLIEDTVEYKDRQRQAWDNVASEWEKWWPMFERNVQVVSDRIVESAALSPGKRVLDLATGIGEPAITAARLIGPDGKVVATDLSSKMLAIARKRADQLGLNNIEFRQMDAEAVDRLQGHFDAILCRWGLFFLPDLKVALERMRQKLASDGRIVAAVWGEPQKVPPLSLPMKIAGEVLQRRPPAGPGVFSLSDKEDLMRKFSEAGFAKPHIEELTLMAGFESAGEFTRFTRDVSAPVKMLIADQPPEKQNEIWDAIARAAGQFARPDGSLRMPMTTIIVMARI